MTDQQQAHQRQTKELINGFNKPYQSAVAIDCTMIGDDNDYSCFLSNVIYKLWKAGEKETALKLSNTDPLKIGNINAEILDEWMKSHEKFEAEQKEMQRKIYRD